ncbi:MAG: DUF5305 family protein [Dehalococcoidales bacterium]|jgi:hypothetical protein
MKIALPVISLVLLIASIFGACKAYSLPTETYVTGEVSVLDYRHQGEFDYLVSLKPSNLYGPVPQETPPLPEVMKYPSDNINRINVAFNYRFIPDMPVANVSAEAEIRAIVEGSGSGERTEIVLVPKTRKTGDFSLTFPLDFSDNATDGLIMLSDNVSGSRIVITAYVYATFDTGAGPVFESFTQSLPLRANGPLLEVDGELHNTIAGNAGALSYEQQGEFSYEVYFKATSPFGPIILTPPTMTPPEPGMPVSMTQNDIILTRLIDTMSMDYAYHLEANKPINQLHESVEINAILENPGKWSKTIQLIPQTDNSGNFSATFPLDLQEYIDFFNSTQSETGVSASARNLTIRVKVHASAITDYGNIDEDFTQSITADLGGDTLTWSDNLTRSQSGSIKTTTVTPQTRKYLGLPVPRARTLYVAAACVFFVLLGFSLFWYFWYQRGRLTANDLKAQQAQQRYKSIIVEVTELPEVKPGETVILLNSLDDLIKTAENLLKPLLHKAEGQQHIYCVFDGNTRYEYHLS